MYIRQNRVKQRLGSFVGDLGQAPSSMITVTDPTDGSQITFTGASYEIAQCQTLVGLVSSAVSLAKNKNFSQARTTLSSAKNMLGALGSARDKGNFLVNKAETFINNAEGSGGGTSIADVLTGVGSIFSALAPAATTAIQTQASLDAAKLALKAGQGQQTVYLPAQTKDNTGLIIAIVGGVVALGVVVLVMQKK